MRTATQGASVPAGDGGGLQTPVEVSKRVLDWVRQQIADTRTEENGGVRGGERVRLETDRRRTRRQRRWCCITRMNDSTVAAQCHGYFVRYLTSGLYLRRASDMKTHILPQVDSDVRVVQVTTTFWNRPSTQAAKSSPEELGRALRFLIYQLQNQKLN